jgi:hypothetical protein
VTNTGEPTENSQSRLRRLVLQSRRDWDFLSNTFNQFMPRIWLLERVYGRLTVVGESEKKHCTGSAIWECECECGNRILVPARYLQSGGTQSCGCYRRDRMKAGPTHPSFKHGHSPASRPSATYHSYRAMLARCYDEGSINYQSYGAKGVRVCRRWRKSFVNFLADMGERPDGKTLDRKDPTKSYSESNCRWATREEQDANRRSNFEENWDLVEAPY